MSEIKTYESNSEEETLYIAESIGRELRAGDIICLDGDLGAGKTVFAKGLAKGLSVTEYVDSPTFTIVKEYEGRLPLYHFDMYRLGDESELLEIGYEEYFFSGGVTLIEWPERVLSLIPKSAIWITITRDLDKGFDYRLIRIRREAC